MLTWQGPGKDAAAAAIVAHLLADFERPGAHDSALSWLHALFAAQPQQGSTAPVGGTVETSAQSAGVSAVGQTAAGASSSRDSAVAVGDAATGQGSASDAAADAAVPSAYESVLLALLEGLRCRSVWLLHGLLPIFANVFVDARGVKGADISKIMALFLCNVSWGSRAPAKLQHCM
jgi:hypothetical protein